MVIGIPSVVIGAGNKTFGAPVLTSYFWIHIPFLVVNGLTVSTGAGQMILEITKPPPTHVAIHCPTIGANVGQDIIYFLRNRRGPYPRSTVLLRSRILLIVSA